MFLSFSMFLGVLYCYFYIWSNCHLPQYLLTAFMGEILLVGPAFIWSFLWCIINTPVPMLFAPSCGRIFQPGCLEIPLFPKVVLQLKLKFTLLPVFCIQFLFTGACSFSLPPWKITKRSGHIVRGMCEFDTCGIVGSLWAIWENTVFPTAHGQVSCWGPGHGQQQLDTFNILSCLYLPFPSISSSFQLWRAQLNTLIEKVFSSSILHSWGSRALAHGLPSPNKRCYHRLVYLTLCHHGVWNLLEKLLLPSPVHPNFFCVLIFCHCLVLVLVSNGVLESFFLKQGPGESCLLWVIGLSQCFLGASCL